MSLGNDLMIKHIESCDYCILISDIYDFIYEKLKTETDNQNKEFLNKLLVNLNSEGEDCFNNSMI